MGRKMLTREVTKTTVRSAKMEVRDGRPVAIPMEEKVFLGNKSMEQAQRLINKTFKGQTVTVTEVLPETLVYEMEVEKFIELAKVKETNK